MMKLKKKLLSSAMAVALAGGVAFSGSASAISVAEDGIGQVLLAPIYFANTAYSTKVAIVNTRNDVAVKAKVVFRSKKDSTEVLDFICFLTPADVCRFEIRHNPAGDGAGNTGAYMWSDDDSILSDFNQSTNTPVFASQQPVTKYLYDQNLGVNDINEIGHMEVIGVYSVASTNIMVPRGTFVQTETTVQVAQGMSKVDLFKIFYSTRSDGEPDTTSRTSLDDYVGQDESGALAVDVDGPRIRSTDPTTVRLAGYMEVSTTSSDRMGYRIPVLAGEAGDNIAGGFLNMDGLGFDGRVISNTRYDVTVAQETGIGGDFGGRDNGTLVGTVAYDNIREIEHALAASNLKATYEDDAAVGGVNRTQLIVTFPTRYKHRERIICENDVTVFNPLVPNEYSDPFRIAGDIQYALSAYDNQEHDTTTTVLPIFSGGSQQATIQTITEEVNYFLPQWPSNTADKNFESGWFNLTLIPEPGCTYPGAPTLSYMHKYRDFGAGVADSWLVPVAHEPERRNR